MELCTAQSIYTFHKISRTTHLVTNSSPALKQTIVFPPSGRNSHLRFRSRLQRAAMSEESSSGPNQYVVEEREGAVVVEDSPPVEKNVYSESRESEVAKEEESTFNAQLNEFLTSMDIKLDSEDTSSILLYGSGALIVVWLASIVVAAIDSIPLFSKLMEVVGVGYTFWFTTRYLLFKKNRDELAAKIDELKQQVLGSNDE